MYNIVESEVKMENSEWKNILADAVFEKFSYNDGIEETNMLKSIHQKTNMLFMTSDTQKRTEGRVSGNCVLEWGGDFDYKS